MIRSFGKYILMLYYIFLKPEKFSVYWKRFIEEIIQLGIKSLFIVSIMSAFMGAVLVIQTATAIESGWIPDYTVGFIVTQSMLLEFCPTIISLILAGKVGSNIASELGTMRVTEQIDAIPSSRPVKPSLSVVVAFTLILLCSNEQIFERFIINCSL